MNATLPFYVNRGYPEWSSFNFQRACRSSNAPISKRPPANASGNCVEMRVGVVSCRELFALHGVPQVLKIDVNGNEHFCVESIATLGGRRPGYVVTEVSEASERIIGTLHGLGYREFKSVPQMPIHGIWGVTSGPVGEFGLDCRRSRGLL